MSNIVVICNTIIGLGLFAFIAFTMFLDAKNKCKHLYEINKSYPLKNVRQDSIVGDKFILQCKHCGELKVRHFLNPTE